MIRRWKALVEVVMLLMVVVVVVWRRRRRRLGFFSRVVIVCIVNVVGRLQWKYMWWRYSR
jgi:hypothetical protein